MHRVTCAALYYYTHSGKQMNYLSSKRSTRGGGGRVRVPCTTFTVQVIHPFAISRVAMSLYNFIHTVLKPG